MRLIIEGTARDFTPIKAYRAAHDLPASFGVALFQPKDFDGLGSIDRAGAELNAVRIAVLNAIPEHLPPQDWLAFLPRLTRFFTTQLYAINHAVGLQPVEVDFAAGGFSDVCHAYAYAALRALTDQRPTPDYAAVYADWLANSVTVAPIPVSYKHQGEVWAVRVVTHAYGRAGLIIERPTATDTVQDSALGCPAEGYMAVLLGEVVEKLFG
jgi:hypothetical protein